MDERKDIAACQPKLRAFHAKQQFEYAGASGGFIDKWGYPFCRGRLFDSYENDEGQYDDTTEVAWATGACLVIRKSDWNEVNGLDADFFAHMEEIDCAGAYATEEEKYLLFRLPWCITWVAER
jgi:GT2 family glycosyltransferase